jgi:hypothetical protein
MYTAHFVSAEIDRLKKLQAANLKEEKLGEIPRPTKSSPNPFKMLWV